jgi:hypothetical protein
MIRMEHKSEVIVLAQFVFYYLLEMVGVLGAELVNVQIYRSKPANFVHETIIDFMFEIIKPAENKEYFQCFLLAVHLRFGNWFHL